MIREPALAHRKQNIQSVEVPFKEIPHQSELFLDFLAGSPSLNAFYPERKTTAGNFAKKVLDSYQINRDELCAILQDINLGFGAGVETKKNINRLRQDRCVAVVTGQQAGLFSGPLLTIYKALTAIKAAAEYSQSGIDAVPIFWIAEEDHDFDEVSSTFLVDDQNHVAKISNRPSNNVTGKPVAHIEFDATIEKTKEEFLELLSDFGHADEIRELLGKSYSIGETFSSAFAKILALLCGKFGLIILTPMDSRLKKLVSPIFRRAFERTEQLISAILARDENLKTLGYAPQVKFERHQFPFFLFDENFVRRPLRRNEDNTFKVRESSQTLSIDDLFAITESSPERISPSALMRPVVQDYLLPTVLYVGGAAEISYFAQSSAIYDVLNRPATRIQHRASLTIIPPRIIRTLEKANLSVTGIFSGKEFLVDRLIDDEIPRETAAQFDAIEQRVSRELDRLEDNFRMTDPTLLPTLAKRRRKILYHVEVLRKKFRRAHFSRDEVLRRKIENLLAVAYPNDGLQERTLSTLLFVNVYGEDFIEMIYRHTKTSGETHTILIP